MTTTPLPGGTYRLADDLTVTRFGYGAMQLTGPSVLGPPADPDEALRVLRTAADLGITHIDTSDVYGPVVANELIRKALRPYPDRLHIATKVGALRDAAGGWPAARSAEQIRVSVQANLDSLGLDVLDLVYLRAGDAAGHVEESIEEAFSTLAELRQQGLIRHLGVSNVTPTQIAEARAIAPVVAVQNLYNLAHRADDPLVDELATDGIAYVPYFPLGGFTPLQSGTLARVAARHETSPLSVALAWLLHRSPTILLIPGTSKAAHLRQNATGADLALSADDLTDLATIAADAS